MTVVPVAYDIPEALLARLASGEYMRFGSVVRDSTKIITHLKEVPLPSPDQAPDGAAALAALKNPKLLIGLGVVVVLAAAGGIAVWAAKGKTKRMPEVPPAVARYNEALAAYLESMQSGKLDAGVIDRLIEALDGLKEATDEGRLTIEFSPKQAETLVRLVTDYTQRLAEANALDAEKLAAGGSSDGGNPIVDLRERLRVQREIFGDAA